MIRVEMATWGHTLEDLRRLAVQAPHRRARERFLALALIADGTDNETVHGVSLMRRGLIGQDPLLTPTPPHSADGWDALPGEVRTLINSNSHHSSKPPSSDPIQPKRQPPRLPLGKKRGEQLGHQRATRPLVPPERLHDTVAGKPSSCARCGRPWRGRPQLARHQVAEIPSVRSVVIEYQIHHLTCPGCGATIDGSLPEGGPRGSFGPRLRATLSLLTGEFRLANVESHVSPAAEGSRGDYATAPTQ